MNVYIYYPIEHGSSGCTIVSATDRMQADEIIKNGVGRYIKMSGGELMKELVYTAGVPNVIVDNSCVGR